MLKAFLQCIIIAVIAVVPATANSILNPSKVVWSEEVLGEGEVFLPTALDWGKDVLWLDARHISKFKKEHIPGALPLNEDDWDGLLEKVMEEYNPSKKIVVYCGSETCKPSHDVAERLRKQVGWKDVFVLKGGWEAWQNHKQGK